VRHHPPLWNSLAKTLARPPRPSGHHADTFLTLIPACAAFYALAVWFSQRAWAEQFERYSFLFDHLHFICLFLFRITATLTAAALARILADRAIRRVSTSHKTLSVCVCLLDAAYAAILLTWFVLFALQTIRTHSPSLYYTYYRTERFPYSPILILSLSTIATVSFALARLFHTHRRLRDITSAPILSTLFQTMGFLCFCTAATLACIIWFALDLTWITEVLLLIGCLYAVCAILRGLVKTALRGDMTAAFPYPPLLRLPDNLPLFNRKLSWSERTGLSFQSLWTLRYTVGLIPPTFLCGVVLFLLSTCFYTVEPHQAALLYHLGSLRSNAAQPPGFHIKLPFPIERVEITDVTRTRSVQIGYAPSSNRDNLWTSAHGGEEYTFLLGEGNELIALNLNVAYHIDDLRAYTTQYVNPETLLAAKAYELIVRKSVSSNLNDMLSADRQGLSETLCLALAEYAVSMEMGIAVHDVIVESIHPPLNVVDVYQDVVSADVRKDSIRLKAEGDAISTVNRAQEQGESIRLQAIESQIQRLAQAHREAMVFEYTYLAYEASPQSYILRKQVGAYQRLLERARVYAFSPGTRAYADRFFLMNGTPLTLPASAPPVE
jgi:membrane protease subunit HflK